MLNIDNTIRLLLIIVNTIDVICRMAMPDSDFAIFRPESVNGKPVLAVLIGGDESNKSLAGHFRIAIEGSSPLRFDIDLVKILGFDPLPEALITVVQAPRGIFFRDNAWFSTWTSLGDSVCAGETSINPRGISEKPWMVLNEEAKKVLMEPDNTVCYRYEVAVAEAARRIVLRMRFLPAPKKKLDNHSAFDCYDVNTIGGAEVLLEHHAFVGSLADLNDKYPMAPIIFSSVKVTEEDYRVMLEEGFKSVLKPIRVHGELERDQVKAYLKRPSSVPKVNSGLLDDPKTRMGKKKRAKGTMFEGASGTCQLVKFGTLKPLVSYIRNQKLSDTELKYLCLHLTSGTWDSYFTHWNTFLRFCELSHTSCDLPASVETLIEYLGFLRTDKGLNFGSVKSYKSGLRKLHEINGVDLKNFEHQRVKNVMAGIKHECLILGNVKAHRCIVSWSIMNILGHELANSGLDPWDIQMIWSLMLFAYFGSRRMGELISVSKRQFEPMTTITWDKVKLLKDDLIVMIILLPKVSEDPVGVAVDYKSWPEKTNFCPVLNFKYLAHLRVQKDNLDLNEPVFRLSNGDLMTQAYMNELLERFLRPHFPSTIGKWTCHSFRAGVPSSTAANPAIFSEAEIKLLGKWTSDAVERYTRLNGMGAVKVQEKFQKFLRY